MSAQRYDTPEPFTIDIPERVLADLDERLRKTRWPVAVGGVAQKGPWEYGTDIDVLRAIVDHWRHGYDWRQAEAELNRFPQYLVDIGAQRLHFIREPGTAIEGGLLPVPLILSHGWPGSTMEFAGMIDKLAHPENHGGNPLDAFDVVVPSLPGYGFSGPPMRQKDGSGEWMAGPIGPRAIAGLWHRLMHDALNYRRAYGAQGGDWGSIIASWLAFDHPGDASSDEEKPGVMGLHLNMMVMRPGIDMAQTAFSAEEADWLKRAIAIRDRATAYQRINATKPQTIAPALTDSPVGLLSWIIEKFHGWGDCRGDLLARFTMDQLITNAMIYWVNASMGTASWLYRGVMEEKSIALPLGQKVVVPTGFLSLPADLAPPPPRAWLERAYNLRRFTAMDKGGHFAALEEPDALVEDIREFFRPLRLGAAND